MKKFATGGFPDAKGLLIQTDGELCGSLGGKTLFPNESKKVSKKLRRAIKETLLFKELDILQEVSHGNHITNV